MCTSAFYVALLEDTRDLRDNDDCGGDAVTAAAALDDDDGAMVIISNHKNYSQDQDFSSTVR